MLFSSTTEKQLRKKLTIPFKLPIHYTTTHSISSNVSNDLELIERESISMYDYLLQPSHVFSKNLTKEWSKVFTSDVDFLKNTQTVIEEYNQIHNSQETFSDYSKIDEIWREIQTDDDFIERYAFMDWDMLKHLNDSSSFLQTLSIIQMISPLLSLLMPFFILFFPFLLLLSQGNHITFESYIITLKTIAKNHFIGKLLNINSLNPQNLIYLFISIVFYFFSTYQNIIATFRFYKNVKNMNENLYTLKNYLHFTHPRIQSFIDLHREKPKYTEFCNISQKHCNTILNLNTIFENIHPFSHSLYTLNNIGEMLKKYYQLYTNQDIIESIEYSFGFEGYLDHIKGLSDHIEKKNIAFSLYNKSDKTKLNKQYYPCHIDKNPVKNDISLDKNIIITGPNASGKTTMLKSTTLNVIFSQQFGCGFYESANIQLYTHIHSYLNIPDTSERDSLFQAESRRCKEILDSIKNSDQTAHHLCIFDELYSGTNYKDATKSATSFLKYLSKRENVDYLLTTHYTLVCKKLKKEKKIALFKMNVQPTKEGEFKYLYKIKKGISVIEGGINILKEMNYPQEIINDIKQQ